jgi:hypothetical protein
LRRAQVARNSQSVRNLLTNPALETSQGSLYTVRTNLAAYPSFEAGGSNGVVGTNLATNPSMEATSGTVYVRTNLVVNPSFETNTTSWLPNTGSPTLAVDSSHAYVGTNGLKLTSTLTSADIAVLFAVNLNASTTYTLSYYVYSPDARTSSFDIAGTGWTPSGLGTTSVPANTWTRVTATFTTPSTSPGNTTFYLHNGGGPTTIGTSLWIDAVLLEVSFSAGTYFDGATAASGDFTHAWTGAANASTSVKQAPGVTSYGPNNNGSAIWSSTTLTYTGTKSLACKSTGLNSNNGTSIYVPPLTANTTYTLSTWVYLPAAYGAGISVAAGGSSFTLIRGNVVSTVGAWTRSSVTFTTGATGPFDAYAYVITGSGDTPAAGTIFYVDGWLLEQGAVLNAYYDGATAAAGDFTYAWSGAANASTSYKLAPAVTGWQPRWFGGSGTGVTYQSKQGINGGLCLRKLFIKGDNSPQDTGINPVSPYVPVTAGTVYTASTYFRCSVSQHMSIYVQWFDVGLASLGFTAITDLGTVSANTWTRFSYTATAPANATAASFIFGPYTSASAMPAGGTYDFDQCLIEASPILREYFDGANPIQNRHANPSLESNSVDWNYWAGSAGAATGTRQTTGGWVGTGFWRVAWTSSQTAQYQLGGGYTDTAVTPGLTYSASIKARANRGQVLRMSMEWVNAAKDNTVASPTTGPDVTVSANAWTELKMENIVVPANAAYCRITVYQAPTGTQWLVGDTLDLDAAFVVSGATVGPYYEGAGDFTFAWSSTANASTTTMKAYQPTGVADAVALGRAISSTLWTNSGTKSLRIVPASTSNDTFAEIGNMVGTAFVAGRKYTIAGTKYQSALVTSPATLGFRANLGGAEVSFTYKTAATNTVGAQRVVATFVPTGSAMAFLRVYNGGYGADVWWDDLVLVEGDYTGNPIDGGRPFSKWDGTAHASTSIGYA